MGYVNVAQNRDNLCTVVKTAMENGFHKIHEFLDCLRKLEIPKTNSGAWS
jgi:hypothetical protein